MVPCHSLLRNAVTVDASVITWAPIAGDMTGHYAGVVQCFLLKITCYSDFSFRYCLLHCLRDLSPAADIAKNITLQY